MSPVSLDHYKLLADIVRYKAWCLVVPAYPKALVSKVA
jgi:hypothetical protein